MTMVQSTFPGSGQALRIVMIDGEPWFATADVCKVLGRGNPSRASQIVDPEHRRTVNTRRINLTPSEVNRVSAGGIDYHRGSPMINLVSEAGLYVLIMRSDKGAAKPFQQWVTSELIPSIRRGDVDVERERRRLRETVGEALGEGGVAARAVVVSDLGLTVCADGSVHCSHGEMSICFPAKEEDTGPPFGPYFRCPEVEAVGIAGRKVVEMCARVKFVDLVRRLARPERVQRERERAGVVVEIGSRVVARGAAWEVAELLRELGEAG